MYEQTIIKKIKKDYQKKARERYKNLSIEEKEKKAEYGLEKSLKRWKTKSCLV